MGLNKTYWEYSSAHSEDWGTYGIKYADKQIYANPNFSWGNLDFSFPTSFRKGKVTKLVSSGSGQAQACSTVDAVIYNTMIKYFGSGNYCRFYKDDYYSYYSSGSEGYVPVIDIDTHEFAYKMTLRLFSGGNWITVNAVDFVNNYDNYDAHVYGYINNYLYTGQYYGFCNFYDCGASQFSVKANYLGYRTIGYTNWELGGHVVSGQTAWSNRSIWQLCALTAGNHVNLSYPCNMFFPYEIPELTGESWNAGNTSAPAALMTAGYYTNHAVLTYSDQRVYMPLKHILKNIVVNCGLVLLDSNDVKWISMVDENGLCQDTLVLLSSDEAKESSIYNTRTSDNNLNPNPPPPPPGGDDDDNDDPTATTGAPFAVGLAHYYVSTAGSAALSQISEAMSTWDIDATKKDLYKNLISCKLIKPPAGIPSTPSVFEIYGVKPQYQGADITIPAVDGNPDITFGPYTISRKFNDFRDYAPYTKVEIHLPYCGWCALPSHVVGNSLSVHYYTDIIAATCKAVVFCNNNIVAEAAGVIGLDIPFASENVGAKVAAATSGLLSYGQGALQASAGIGQMAATRSSQGLKNVAGGLSQVISGYTQMAMTANENWTEICGKNGDGCCLSGATDIIIKITRPKYGGYDTAPFVPPGFAHSVGFVSGKQVRVSNITGLLIADNVDTSGISGATDAERAEIKRVLESGLYVNTPPE